MKKIIPLLLGSVVLLTTAACGEVARTSADAPNDPQQTTAQTQNPTATDSDQAANNSDNNQVAAQENREDATNDVRQAQIESDQRAIEQRNQVTGNPAAVSDGDLASLVRNRLETGIPSSQLAVEAEDGIVTIAGTVLNQADLQKAETLAQEVQGVKSVTMKATVGQPKPTNN